MYGLPKYELPIIIMKRVRLDFQTLSTENCPPNSAKNSYLKYLTALWISFGVIPNSHVRRTQDHKSTFALMPRHDQDKKKFTEGDKKATLSKRERGLICQHAIKQFSEQ